MPELTLQQRLLHGECLPNGWHVVKFGSVTRIANGQVSPKDKPYDSYLHIGPENIESNTGRIGQLQTAAQQGLISGKYVFDDKAIVYAKIRPNLNKVCVPGFTGLCSADAYPIWASNGMICRGFLAHYMRSEMFLRQSIAASMRTGMPKINRPDLQGLKIALPPLDEQEHIAAILDCFDRAAESTRCVRDAKKKLAHGLMQQLLSGRCRLSGFNQDGWIEHLLLGNVPCGWGVVSLSEVVKKVTRRNTDGEKHVLTASGRHGLVDQNDYFNRSVAGANLAGYYLLKNGEFAYNRSRMKGYQYGAIKRLDKYPQGVLSTLYLCFGIKSADVDSDYLQWYFEGGQMGRQLARVTPVGGRAHGLLNITAEDFYSIKIMLPPKDEQIAIAKVLNTAQREIDLLEDQLQAIKTQKKGLMQKLLTGQVRVKEVANA